MEGLFLGLTKQVILNGGLVKGKALLFDPWDLNILLTLIISQWNKKTLILIWFVNISYASLI